jgi:hypothetical protein
VRIKSLQSKNAAADCHTFGGTVTIADANTTGTFTFGTSEDDAGYDVLPGAPTQTGGPAAGASTILGIAKLGASFTITVSAAPGAGKSVTFPFIIVRR